MKMIDYMDEFIKASLKEFRLNDVSSAHVAIRNHEEIDVVKELISISGNSSKNPFVLHHADLGNVTQGVCSK